MIGRRKFVAMLVGPPLHPAYEQFLEAFDPRASGGNGQLKTTVSPDRAMKFRDPEEGRRFVETPAAIGKPTLTYFDWAFVPVRKVRVR